MLYFYESKIGLDFFRLCSTYLQFCIHKYCLHIFFLIFIIIFFILLC
nr:MAG TPA: hypothetical protein [Caudoviricetes sp.]